MSDLEEVEPLEPEPVAPAAPAPVTFKDPFEDVKPRAPTPPALSRVFEGAREPSIAKPLPQRDSLPMGAQVSASIPARPATLPPGGRLSAPRVPPPAPGADAAPPGTRPSSPNVPAVAPPGASAPPARAPAPGPSSLRPSLPRPAASVPAPARASAPPGEEAAMRNLFDRYVAARKETGEAGDIRYETVAKQVRRRSRGSRRSTRGQDVRLDVTIKDGKAILRPVVTMKK